MDKTKISKTIHTKESAPAYATLARALPPMYVLINVLINVLPRAKVLCLVPNDTVNEFRPQNQYFWNIDFTELSLRMIAILSVSSAAAVLLILVFYIYKT